MTEEYRSEVEAIVSAERRWYAERTALLIVVLLAGVSTGYASLAIHRRDSQTGDGSAGPPLSMAGCSAMLAQPRLIAIA